MDSNSDKTIEGNNSVRPHSQSLIFQNILLEPHKAKPKNSKGILKSNRLYELQRQKGNFKYLEKYVHKHFINLYKNSKNDYNVRMIDDILNNESSHLVAEFKDYLIMGDITEFLQKSYNLKECKKYLPKIYEYYNSCSVIFPNYVCLHESKYIYKNIRKKQKVIDNQQEQEEKQEKIKKGNLKIESKDDFFTTKTFYSILEQTNTSNLKLFFGIKDNMDVNETPNDIMSKLEQAEKEAIKRKINLIKSSKNSHQISNIMENSNNYTSNNIKTNNNSNITNNISKIFNKNASIKEKNKSVNNNNNNYHYLTSGKRKNNNLKLNNNINSNSNLNLNLNKEKNFQINNYISKNPSINKRDNIPKKNIKSNSNNIIYIDNYNIGKNNNRTTTFYGNTEINPKKKDIKKYFIENSHKHHQIYFRNENNSHKNIKKQLINSLIPSKSLLTKIFNNNFDNNNSLKHNSFNFINNKHIEKSPISVNQLIEESAVPTSPSSITIQANPFRNKKNYNININIKESNSTRNITSNKLNENIKSKEKLNIKNIQDKLKYKRNKNTNTNIIKNQKMNNYNNTITTTNVIKNNYKNINNNKNYVYNKTQMNNNNYGYFNSFRTIGNNSPIQGSVNNPSVTDINNSNNNIIKKSVNIQKINSTSNIQKPMNMNMNININMNNKNKIYFNNGSSTNIINNKIYPKSPLSVELETIKVTKKKRILYPRTKTFSDVSNYTNKHQNIYNNYNYYSNIINSIKNANSLSNDKNHYIDSINHTSLNSNNVNEDYINTGLNPSYNNNYANAKKNLLLDEFYRKKSIIVPFNKEINNINININGYNPPSGSLTSRASNNGSRKKYKKYKGIQEINLNSPENKMHNNKSKMNKKSSHLLSRNEGNPVKIKKMYDSIKSNKHMISNKTTGYLSARKK